MEELKIYEDKMNKTLDVLLSDFGTIRAGRANPHVLDKIKVDYYGTPTPLQQVGNVSVPECGKPASVVEREVEEMGHSRGPHDCDPAVGKEPLKTH